MPKAQSFITSGSTDSATIGRGSHVEHAARMASEGGEGSHGRIRPHDDLVLGVAVGRDQFLRVLRPAQVTNLRASVNTAQWLFGGRQHVPEANAAIGSAAARAQQSPLVGRPADGLDGSSVFRVAPQRHRLRQGHVPHEQLVVVAARGQLLGVGRPAQPAHLLLVCFQLAAPVVARAHVAQEDGAIATARGQQA